MPLATLDRNPPPFFKQGSSALSKLIFFSALALFLMISDARFHVAYPLRAVIATLAHPVQWLTSLPVLAAVSIGGYFDDLSEAKATAQQARESLVLKANYLGQVEQLELENKHLRKLLSLNERVVSAGSVAAQTLYEAADPYTKKIIIGGGLNRGIDIGSPVIDEQGVLGQVTRVYPFVSEVTLVVDREHATPVLNSRTGARSVAYGDTSLDGGGLELRFMAGNADVQKGDILSTSGIDGVYPAGLPVARVEKVERRADSAFARISCTPLAHIQGASHVMVLKPISNQIPARPPEEHAMPQAVTGHSSSSGAAKTGIKP
jgi:rod shape-determining protein MreC